MSYKETPYEKQECDWAERFGRYSIGAFAILVVLLLTYKVCSNGP